MPGSYLSELTVCLQLHKQEWNCEIQFISFFLPSFICFFLSLFLFVGFLVHSFFICFFPAWFSSLLTVHSNPLFLVFFLLSSSTKASSWGKCSFFKISCQQTHGGAENTMRTSVRNRESKLCPPEYEPGMLPSKRSALKDIMSCFNLSCLNEDTES